MCTLIPVAFALLAYLNEAQECFDEMCKYRGRSAASEAVFDFSGLPASEGDCDSVPSSMSDVSGWEACLRSSIAARDGGMLDRHESIW